MIVKEYDNKDFFFFFMIPTLDHSRIGCLYGLLMYGSFDILLQFNFHFYDFFSTGFLMPAVEFIVHVFLLIKYLLIKKKTKRYQIYLTL